MPDADKDRQILLLRDRVAQLWSQVEILRRLRKPDNTTRYTLRERHDLPRRRAHECFGVVRSTFYRGVAAHRRPAKYGQAAHGSIAVTERVNRTLKEEWLRRVPLVRGIGHLGQLCGSFAEWYSEWRPHMTLDGLRHADWYGRDAPEPVASDAKVLPLNIERRRFADVRVEGFRLQDAA